MAAASAHNPFEFGRELTLEELVDRGEELDELVQVLTSGGKHFLIGPRRFGKTSLLGAAATAARSRKATVLRYNAELFPTVDELPPRIVADCAAMLSGTVEKIGKSAARFFKSLKPEITYNPAHGTWTATLGVTARAAAVPLLAEALDGLERAARSRSKPTALILDEFQHVVATGVAAERQIRGAIQGHKSVGYAFAGSDTRLIAAMTGDTDRPLFRLGSRRFLGPIPRKAFRAFLRRGLGVVATVSDQGIEAILDTADDVPYNVQLLAHACWERCRESPRKTVLTPDLVQAAQNAMARRSDPLFTQTWTSLTSAQQRALLAVLHEEGRGLTSRAVTHRYRLGASTMQRALQALTQRGVLREELREGAATLKLEDPLFGTWLRTTIPPLSPGE